MAADIVALHGTDPASVYLAAWARTREVDKAAIEHALYEERTLVRMLGMRRTVFVVPAALVPVIQAACTDQIAERLRRQLPQVVRRRASPPDAASWLKEAGGGHGAARWPRAASATGAELARDEPRLRTQIIYAADNPYGGAVNLTTQPAHVAVRRGADRARPPARRVDLQPVHLVRGPGAGAALTAADARAELARRWLSAVRPGSGLRPAVVDRLGGRAGQAGAGPARARRGGPARRAGHHARRRRPARPDAPAPQPWAALLPALDPTAMGWRERDWYVGEHAAALFDRSGNIGPTAWWDGRIVGGWAQRKNGEITVRLLEDIGAEAAAASPPRPQRLGEWIGPGARLKPRVPHARWNGSWPLGRQP